MIDDDISPYTKVLDKLIGSSRLTKAELEQKLRWSKGRLTKLLKGTVDLKVEHVLALLEAINVDPLHFYALVHRPEGAPGRGGKSVAEILIAAFEARGTPPQPLLLPVAITSEELDTRIAEAIQKALSSPALQIPD